MVKTKPEKNRDKTERERKRETDTSFRQSKKQEIQYRRDIVW